MENVAQKKKANVFDSFLAGARKGANIFAKNMLPSIIMAYTIIYILQETGIMDVIADIFGPVMGIFGLPSVAILCIATGILSRSGGCALAAAFVLDGSLTPEQCTIILPTLMLLGGIVGQWVRVVSVCGTSSSRQKYVLGVTFFTAILSLWVARLVFSIF